jgi:hypothetical protein
MLEAYLERATVWKGTGRRRLTFHRRVLADSERYLGSPR